MHFRKMVGEKCYLSPIDVDDARLYVEWLNNPEVTRFLTLSSQVVSMESEREILTKLAKEQNYGIIDIETDSLLGNAGLFSIDHVHRTAEAGIFIGNQEYWGRGYGTEAMSLLVEYGFRVLNLHNIMLRVYDFNERAIRSYEKSGFRKFGERREAHVSDMKAHNVIYMDILPGDFFGRNSP